MALTAEHVTVLQDRAIDPAYAERLGVQSVDLREEKRLVEKYHTAPSYPGIPLYEITGALIRYQRCLDGIDRFRVRSDVLEYTLPGPVEGQADVGARTVKVHRYLAQKGVSVAPFWTPEALDIAGDTTKPIYMTEAPLKAMSLACNGFPAGGMGGVLAGAHDADVKEETGEIVGNREFLRINWQGRRCYIVYDASLTDSKKPLVALGAVYLGLALRAAGAEPWLVRIPLHHPTEDDIMAGGWYRPEDQGPDDFVHRHGVEAFRRLVDVAEPLEPLVRLGLRTFRSQREPTAVAVSWLSDLPTLAYLYAAGDAALAAFLTDAKLPAKLARGASLPAATYFRAVLRSMSAFKAARPICPCLLISSISFLTCASLTGRTATASPSRRGPAPGRPTTPLGMGRSNRRRWGDVIVAQHQHAARAGGCSGARALVSPCARLAGLPSVGW